MFIRRIIIALLLTVSVFLTANPASVAQAESKPIELRLGSSGSTSWNINSVKPGDNGTITVTLSNAGTIDGFVTIWISNLVSIEGPARRPGKFADYLRLDVSVPGLETNLQLPAIMAGFPQSTSGSDYVRINPLAAGAEITLVWKWELPPQTGNEVQGNGVSFSINYMLEGLRPREPGPSPVFIPGPVPNPAPVLSAPPGSITSAPSVTLGVTLDGKTSTVEINADGTLAESLSLLDASGNFILVISAGTRITAPDGRTLRRIELTVVNDRFVVPDNMVVLSPIYRITGYDQETELSRINFDPFAIMTINYDPNGLPVNAFTPFIASYNVADGLARHEPLPDSVFEVGISRAVVYHASVFAVVAEVAPPPPSLPASFRLDNLVINPGEARAGQPVSISVDIANDGVNTATYELYLVIDGIVRTIKAVTIEPRTFVTVRFEVSNLAPGNHQVKISGLTGEFRVVNIAVSPPESQINWLFIDLIVAGLLVAGVLVSYVFIRRSQRKGTW